MSFFGPEYLGWMDESGPSEEEIAQEMERQQRIAERFWAMPEPVEPQLEPVGGFLDRFAQGLARTPYQRGSRAGNVLQGVAQGFAGSRLAGLQGRMGENERRREAADVQNQRNAQATMNQRQEYLRRVGDSGKTLASHRWEMRKEAMKPKPLTPEQEGEADAAKISARNRGLRKRGERVPSEGGEEKPFDLDAALNRDGAVQSARYALERVRGEAMGNEEDPRVKDAANRYDVTVKSAIAARLRQARTFDEGRAVLEAAFARYPELSRSPMLKKVAEDMDARFARQSR